MNSSNLSALASPPPAASPPPERPTPERPVRRAVDAEALLRSLAPVVSTPDAPRPGVAEYDEDEETPRRATSRKAAKESRPEPTRRTADPKRATLDVAINPGEGTTAIYVRVPRTTHVALKLLALQNQAEMEGPTELASIVRLAVNEYLDRQRRSTRAA